VFYWGLRLEVLLYQPKVTFSPILALNCLLLSSYVIILSRNKDMTNGKEALIREDRVILETINPHQILTELQSVLQDRYAGHEVKKEMAILIVRKKLWPQRGEDSLGLLLDTTEQRTLPTRAREIPVNTLIFDKSRPFAGTRLLPFEEMRKFVVYNRRGVFIGLDPELPQIWVGMLNQEGRELQSLVGAILPSFIKEEGPTGIKTFLVNLLMTGKAN